MQTKRNLIQICLLCAVGLQALTSGAQTSPPLGINTSGSNLGAFWPTTSPGFVLQWTTDLTDPSSWQTYPDAAVVVDGNFVVYLQPTNSQTFFRLFSNTVVTLGPPSVITTPSTYSCGGIKLMDGTVQPNGLDTTWWFQWGPVNGSDTSTASFVVAGTNTSPVDETLVVGGMTPATTYHYQLYASNAYGIASGGDNVFVTPALPGAVTIGYTNLTSTSVTLLGRVNPEGSNLQGHFRWGLTSNYDSNTPNFYDATGNAIEVDESYTLTGLQTNQTYHYQIVAFNCGGESMGIDGQFTTLLPVNPTSPTATTWVATGVTATCATLNGTLNAHGSSTLAQFEWGTNNTGNTAYTSGTWGLGYFSDTSDHAVYYTACGLTPNTTYHYIIETGGGPGGNVNGGDVTFTTSNAPPAAPTVHTWAATNITATGATLQGDANGNSAGSAISVSFEYARDPSFTSPIYTGTLYGPSGYPQNFGAPVTNLSPATTYYYRINATNDAGSTNGATVIFTTAAAVRPNCPVSIYCPSNIVVTANSPTNVFFTVTASDPCGLPSITSYPPSGSTFPLGTTTVYSSAADANGISSNQCSFTVTLVRPNCPVSIYCPSNIVVTANSPTNVFFTVTASDPCGLPSITSYPPSGSTFPLGTTTVYSSAADANGISSNQCSFQVTIHH